MNAEWALHFDEQTRALAYAVVEGMASTLAAVADTKWTAVPTTPWLSDSINLRIPRAVILQGRKREAVLRVTEASLTLTVCGKGRPDRDIPFSISGTLIDAYDGIATFETADTTLNVVATLAYWQHGLSRPIDSEHACGAEQCRAALEWLGLGAVAQSGLDWRWFSLDPGGDGMHRMMVWSDAQCELNYESPKATATGRRLSMELSDEIDRIVGGRIHVTEGLCPRHPDELPVLLVGAPPSVTILPDHKPELGAMRRAAQNLPDGAELLTDGAGPSNSYVRAAAVTSTPVFQSSTIASTETGGQS